MRVCTYNVHGWQDADGEPNEDRVAALLGRLGCDAVALQEALDRDRDEGQLASVSARLGMYVVEAPADHHLANVLLLRERPIESGAVRLDVLGAERRSAAWATVPTPWGAVNVFCAHLDHVREATRLRQLEVLFAAVETSRGEALVLGDFNALDPRDYGELQWLRIHQQRARAGVEREGRAVTEAVRARGWIDLVRQAREAAGDERGGTLPKALRETSAHGTRVDYVWATPLLASRALVSAEVPASDASDHRPLVVSLRPSFGAEEPHGRRANPYTTGHAALRRYLDAGVEPTEAAHLLPYYFDATHQRSPDGYDEDDAAAWFATPDGRRQAPRFKAWVEQYAMDKLWLLSEAHSPSYMQLHDPKLLPPRTWLVHFSDAAPDVARDGFRFGREDYKSLGLTTWLSDSERRRSPGWNFAFQALSGDAVRAAGRRLYGRHAVLFRAAGVSADHVGDRERQVIFWGPSVRRVILMLSDGEGVWRIEDVRTGRVLREGDYESVARWAIDHEAQYAGRIFLEPAAPSHALGRRANPGDDEAFVAAVTAVAERERGLCLAGRRPEGMCWDVSKRVADALWSDLGIDAHIVTGEVLVDEDVHDGDGDGDLRGHHWLELKRGGVAWVVDATADQFNPLLRHDPFPEVVVAPRRSLRRHREPEWG